MTRSAPLVVPPRASPEQFFPSGVTDEELVRRAVHGDRWAERAVYRRYVQLVAGLAIRLLNNRADAEDVVQDTFVVAISDLGKLRDPASLRSWLLQITVRKVRRRWRTKRLLRRLGLDRSADEVSLASLAAPGISPEQMAELKWLDARIGALAAKERIAWTLRYVEGASLDEVAAASGCSLATAKRRIAAARKHLGLEEAPHE